MAKITSEAEVLEAVREDGSALKHVPEAVKTGAQGAEICLAAV